MPQLPTFQSAPRNTSIQPHTQPHNPTTPCHQFSTFMEELDARIRQAEHKRPPLFAATLLVRVCK